MMVYKFGNVEKYSEFRLFVLELVSGLYRNNLREVKRDKPIGEGRSGTISLEAKDDRLLVLTDFLKEEATIRELWEFSKEFNDKFELGVDFVDDSMTEDTRKVVDVFTFLHIRGHHIPELLILATSLTDADFIEAGRMIRSFFESIEYCEELKMAMSIEHMEYLNDLKKRLEDIDREYLDNLKKMLEGTEGE